jgi:hypothetical protein
LAQRREALQTGNPYDIVILGGFPGSKVNETGLHAIFAHAHHRGEWLGWRHYWARAATWAVPKAGKDVDPETFKSLTIIVLSNADFGDKEFTTCRIAHDISRVIWKGHNIMNYDSCGL